VDHPVGYPGREEEMLPSLTEEQLAELKKTLQQRFAELREEVRQELLRSDEEQYIELAGRVHDTGDASAADLLADVNLAVVDQHINAIREAEAALLRIARGTYGVCVDCGGDIDPKRLLTQPAAKRCLKCQALYERSYAQPTGTKL